jgi:hypothetical protein
MAQLFRITSARMVPRGPLPSDAKPAELIVGFLDTERAAMSEWSADEFNAKAADYFSTHKLNNPPIKDT